MELLISVVNEEQAVRAAEAGARWQDLKDPSLGSLGRASVHKQTQFLAALKPWPHLCRSVALGEVAEVPGEQHLPQPLSGFHFAKLGTGQLGKQTGVSQGLDPTWWARWSRWRSRLPIGCEAVLVAYADAPDCAGLTIQDALSLAIRHQLPYLLIDTFRKDAGGLFQILQSQQALDCIPDWIRTAASHGLTMAWAGQLTIEQMAQLQAWQAAVVGVRSAVCERNLAGEPLRGGDLCSQRLHTVLTQFSPSHNVSGV